LTDTSAEPTLSEKPSQADAREQKGRSRPLGLSWSTWITVAAVGLAAYLLYRTLSGYSYAEIVTSVKGIPGPRLAAAVGFMAASYLTLTLFDYLALRYAGHRLSWRRAALASFTALSLGHSIGFAGVSSGAIRYRFYARWGLDVEDVTKVVLFSGLTVALGLMTLGGSALLLRSGDAADVTGLGTGMVLALGAVLLGLVAAYIAAAARMTAPVTIRKWVFRMPGVKLALAQVGVGALNFALVAACLHQAVAGFADVPYVTVATAYVIANTAALLAHVPGGLGVIEATVLHMIPGEGLIGAVLIFRFVYFLLPLPIGAVSLIVSEFAIRRGR
jgi:glycosyltransferase 2 family protein